MSQQADPRAQQPTVVYRPGPPFVPKPLSLKDQVALYHRYLKTNHVQTRQLVYQITKRANRPEGGYAYCDHKEQDEILAAAQKHSLQVNHPWHWNSENVGRYIASGLTQSADLYLAIGLRAEDIQEIKEGPEVGFNFTCAGSAGTNLQERLLLRNVSRKWRIAISIKPRGREW